MMTLHQLLETRFLITVDQPNLDLLQHPLARLPAL
jgi:hypothetical protein